MMRPVCFLGDSLKCLRGFPAGARHDAGYQLDKVQRGEQPDDFKAMPTVGMGVEEIRVSDSSGAFRVIYLARRREAVYVLHAFQKKTQATPQKDLEIAKKRFGQLLGGRI
jgi:phage-related protein